MHISHLLRPKNVEVFTALKTLESKEFQIAKKAKAHRNLCDAFEPMVVEGEVDYMITLEKSLVLTKEIEWASSKI
jgi:hypothetical protein